MATSCFQWLKNCTQKQLYFPSVWENKNEAIFFPAWTSKYAHAHKWADMQEWISTVKILRQGYSLLEKWERMDNNLM